jgi:hypothetical protein
VHRIVRYELNGKLKVPRPTHEKQQPGIVTAFKNHFPDRIKGLIDEIRDKWGNKLTISYWLQDETRFSHRTESGHKITSRLERKLRYCFKQQVLYPCKSTETALPSCG